MAIVQRLRERGVGIVYVSHRLREIFALADRVTVLRDGACIGTRPIGEVTEATLISMMVGRSIDQLFPKVRSEEHTSELQSRSDLVCRLLLEKKKKKNKSTYVSSLK